MLTRNSRKTEANGKMCDNTDYNVVLAGNPNVGKSTIFNALTGMKQHTGNWTGKTVEYAKGCTKIKDKSFSVVDLPGTYSMISFSPEEEVSRQFLVRDDIDCTVIVIDSSVLERNLSFTLQVLSVTKKAVLCLNLSDECCKNGFVIDEDELSLNLGIPVISTNATKKSDIEKIREKIYDVCTEKTKCFRVTRLYDGIDIFNKEKHKENTEFLAARSKEICSRCIKKCGENISEKTKKLDKILTSKITGIPIMILLQYRLRAPQIIRAVF